MAERIDETLPDDDDLPAGEGIVESVPLPAGHRLSSTDATIDDDDEPGDARATASSPATERFRSNDATIDDDDEPGDTRATASSPATGRFRSNDATLDDGEDDGAAKTRGLPEWLTVDDDDDPSAPGAVTATAGSSMSIVSTVVAGGGVPTAVRRDGTAVTIDEVRRDWGAVSPGGSAGATASVQVADPRSGRTMGMDVSLRPGRLSMAGQSGFGDDFVVESRLGKGGMGAVFRARQLSLGREVAVKVILPDHAASERSRAKFISEAVITGALDHPNIIPLHELGVTVEGFPFYAMKEVRGTPWSSVIDQKTEAENIAILLAVADAVAFAHDRGVIHRDLKPENVMLGDYGEVLLMDWGLAVPHYPDADGRRVAKGRAGTPAYLAPEMARADEDAIGPASDLYLLGAILYEIAAGIPPHSGMDVFSCIAAAANNVIEPTDRDDELVAIARKAMATRPEDRYATVKEFQSALAGFRRHMESLTVAAHARERLRRAREEGAYEEYNRALFGFDEALALWDGNAGARTGLRETRLALAGEALRRGDSDLALSTAAGSDEAEFVQVRAEAERQKREHEARQSRVRRWRMAAGALVGLVILVLSLATLWVNEERSHAVVARDDARRSEADAVVARDRATKSEAEALAARDAAKRSEAEALAQKAIAENALKAKDAAQARETAEREAKEKAKDAELAALREKEAERELRANAELAARTSEELLARAGYLEDSTRWTFDADEARRRQAADAARVGQPARRALPLPGGRQLFLRRVPPGEFVMGSPTKEGGRSADEPLHPVTLTRGFWLGEVPLTRGQWRALVPVESEAALAAGGVRELLSGEDGTASWIWRTRPVPPEEENLPAAGISPADLRELLLPRLAAHAPEGMVFRLPTEAEWEYACRAGTATPYYAGSTTADALKVGWLDENAGGVPHAVGRRDPNAWGFYDMHGNVFEIVADFYSPVFALTAAAGREDPRNDAMPGGRPLRVIRGGSYFSLATEARSAKRETLHDANRHDVVGVRLALVENP